MRASGECWDGTGHPANKKAEEIPLGARIIAVSDAYDMLTDPYPYGVAVSEQHALQELRASVGTRFDPTIVAALERALPHEPQATVAAVAAA